MNISVVNVAVGYGENPILTGINFTLEENTLIGLIGVNGSGKSALLNTLLGEIPVICGKITPDLSGQVSFFPQNVEDPPFLTVGQVVEIGLRSGKYEGNVIDALEICGISHLYECQFPDISGGEKNRAWLAFVLAQNRDVIFLDEPFSMIDSQSKNGFYQLLHDVCLTGKTILVVSHDTELISRHADKILEINGDGIQEH